jgi:pimeloyl-ACP methyl ester carboxylesterase
MTLPAAPAPEAPDIESLGRAWGYESITGVPPEFARRLYHWVDMCDADGETLLAAFRARPAGVEPGSEEWTAYFAELGEREWAHGDSQLALTYLEIAFFSPPFLEPQEFQRAAYRRHCELYVEAGRSLDPPLEVVSIPVNEEQIVGYLRVPGAVERPPVVLVTGGADGWKGHRSLHATQQLLVGSGFATLTIDLPGTGENPFPLEPGSHETLLPVLDWLKQLDRVDGDRLGAHMRSFGGYFAAALAATVPRGHLRAIVSVAPPIHHAFHSPPPFLRPIADWFKTLSLLDQGVLAPNPDQPDLLVVQSLPDPLCPIEDTYLLAEQGLVMDTLVYAQDFHTAMLNSRSHMDFSIDWLARRLA